MGASASPLSGNRHHYTRRLVLEPQRACDCKAWLVCFGEGAGEWLLQNIMYRHRSKHIITHTHTHTPPSTSTAGCTDRLHEYLSEQFIMSSHIRPAFLSYSHVFGSDFQYPADFSAHQHAAQWPALWPGHMPRAAGARLSRNATADWKMFLILSCAVESISNLRHLIAKD